MHYITHLANLTVPFERLWGSGQDVLRPCRQGAHHAPRESEGGKSCVCFHGRCTFRVQFTFLKVAWNLASSANIACNTQARVTNELSPIDSSGRSCGLEYKTNKGPAAQGGSRTPWSQRP